MDIINATKGFTVTYTCADGYVDESVAEASTNLTCNDNLVWSGIILNCKGIIYFCTHYDDYDDNFMA